MLLQVAGYLLDRGLPGVDGVVFLDSRDHKFVWVGFAHIHLFFNRTL